jgi:preprotein translocase subunit YajC
LITTEGQNKLLLGALPTPATEGGIIGQMIATVAGDQRQLKVEMDESTKIKIAQANANKETFQVTTNENGERVITFKDGTIRVVTVSKTDLDDFNSILNLELSRGGGSTISDLKNNKDTSFNGIVNSEDEAIKNGLMQMGALQSNILNVNYDPTHGFLSDVIEVGWNKLLGTTILKSGNLYELNDYGQTIADAAKSYNITGLRMVGHSGGGERLVDGVLNGVKAGEFTDTELRVQFYGTPVSTKDIIDAGIFSGVSGAKNIQHQINKGDFVAENLGGNSSNVLDKNLGLFGPALITNGYKLFLDSSPHSNYFCEGSFCGYDKLNLNNINQARAP